MTSVAVAASCAGLVVWLLGGEAEEAPAFALPEASVRLGADAPRWTVALFVDLEASGARHAFAQASRAVTEGLLAGPAELRLLHAGACPPVARERLRCAGARACECAEKLFPGTGIRLAGAILDLQWEAPELRRVDEALRRTIAPELRASILRCSAEDVEVALRVEEQASFAAAQGLDGGAGGYVMKRDEPTVLAPFVAGDRGETLGVLSVCLARGRCQEEG